MNIGRFRQAHTAFACGFGQLVMALVNTWPSYTSELYLSNTTTLLSAPMTKGEEALLGSLPSLGAMLGTAITGWLINNLGRRNGGVVICLPVLLSWTIISVTTSIKLILMTRFLAGISGGASLVLGPVFTSEVAEDSIRGILASAPMFLYCAGILLSYIIGWCMTYRTIIWANIIFSVAATFLLVLVTESPVYLLRQRKEEEAKLSIAKYRGVPVSSKVVWDELFKLKQQLMPAVEMVPVLGNNNKAEEVEKLTMKEDEPVKPQSTIKLLFSQPASRRAFSVLATLMFAQVFMGMIPVQVYAKTVFVESDPSKADVYTILFAFVLVGGCSINAVITDKAGRRILLITSSILVSLCMTTLGYLLQSKIAPPWVSISVILAYSFSFSFGVGTIPYILLAECFIPEIQNLASIIIVEWVWFLNFFILGIFPFMNTVFGIYGTFYIFGIVGLINALYAYFFVPETKGLSNTQIQDAFAWRRKNG